MGEDRGLPYISYQFIPGESLERRLRRVGRLSLGSSVNLLQQLASAVDYCHSRGIYHGDIKPANIMIDRAEHVVLVDFGVASQIDSGGVLGGTAEYMAQELFNGSAQSAVSDVYALGVTAYQMLAGMPPFTGDTMRLAYSHGRVAVPENDRIPDCAYKAICKAMAKDAGQRWSTAGDFVKALDCRQFAPLPWPPVAVALLSVALLASLVSMCRGAAPAGQVTLTPTSVMVTSTPFATDTPTGGGRGEFAPTDEGRGNPTPGSDDVALGTDTPAPTPSNPPTRLPLARPTLLPTPAPGQASVDVPSAAAGLSEADAKATRRAEREDQERRTDPPPTEGPPDGDWWWPPPPQPTSLPPTSPPPLPPLQPLPQPLIPSSHFRLAHPLHL